MAWARLRAPAELWIAFVGFGAYLASQFLLPGPVRPQAAGAIFAIAGAFNLIWSRRRQAYWFLLVTSVWALWEPVLFRAWMEPLGSRSLFEIYWVLLPPAALLCLVLSPRVRQFAHGAGERPGEAPEGREG